MHGSIVEHRLLPPNTDLYGAFIKALAHHVDEGWQLETFSSTHACAFCHRANERRLIAVESENPGQPSPARHHGYQSAI